MAPTMLYVRNRGYFIRDAPATTGANVRTIGTNRARMMVMGPCFSKKACDSSMYFFLKNRASSLLNRAVPPLLPMKKPTWSPRIAAIGIRTSSAQRGANGSISVDFDAAMSPAVKRSESPGSRGNSKPDSMKTTRRSPTSTHVPKELRRFTGSRNPGNNARLVTESDAACTITALSVPAESPTVGIVQVMEFRPGRGPAETGCRDSHRETYATGIAILLGPHRALR